MTTSYAPSGVTGTPERTALAGTSSLCQWPPLDLYIRDSGRQAFPVMHLVNLQAETNYTWLQWADGKRMLMPRTLKYFSAKLPDEWFIRLNRNTTVNRQYIHRIERLNSESIVYLTNGQSFPVSRRRWPLVRKRLSAHLS